MKYLIIVLLPLSFFGCNQKLAEQSAICGCGVNDPVNNSVWVKKVLSNSFTFANGAQLVIYSGAKFYCCVYNNQNVFYLNNPASSLSLSNQVVFDCSGNILINGVNSIDLQNFNDTKTSVQLLWTK